MQPHHLPGGRAADDSGKQRRQTAEPVSVNPKQFHAIVKEKWGYNMTKRDMCELQKTIDRVKSRKTKYTNDGKVYQNSHTIDPGSQRLNTGSSPLLNGQLRHLMWVLMQNDV